MKRKLRILVVDDDPNMARTLSDILSISGYEAITAISPEEALTKITRDDFDCLLTDVRMPPMSGVELFEEVRKLKPNLPVILMTAYAPDEQIAQGLNQGAVGLLTKPLEINNLLNFLTVLSEQHCIEIVDDDPMFIQTIREILERRGIKVIEAKKPSCALHLLTPSVCGIILDMKLGDSNGLDLFKEIKERQPETPVILVTAFRQEMAEEISRAMQLSAFTCFYKPFEMNDLIAALDKIRLANLKAAIKG